MNYCKPITKINKLFLLILRLSLLLSVLLVGCGGSPSAEVLETVDYAPITTDIWPVSTPEEQGLDPNLVAELWEAIEDRSGWGAGEPRCYGRAMVQLQ